MIPLLQMKALAGCAYVDGYGDAARPSNFSTRDAQGPVGRKIQYDDQNRERRDHPCIRLEQYATKASSISPIQPTSIAQGKRADAAAHGRVKALMRRRSP